MLALQNFVELAITLAQVLLDLSPGNFGLRGFIRIIYDVIKALYFIGEHFIDIAVPMAWANGIDALACVHYFYLILLIDVEKF